MVFIGQLSNESQITRRRPENYYKINGALSFDIYYNRDDHDAITSSTANDS